MIDTILDVVLDVMEIIVCLVVFVLIVLTVPIWILPFMILRPRDNSDDWSSV